jgi:uncharacterized protein YdcH (DUF465 family)
MSHVLHTLNEEFPQDFEVVHRLTMNDGRFRKLRARYLEANHAVNRIEQGIEAADDARLEGLKKLRLALLDEISELIATAKAA